MGIMKIIKRLNSLKTRGLPLVLIVNEKNKNEVTCVKTCDIDNEWFFPTWELSPRLFRSIDWRDNPSDRIKILNAFYKKFVEGKEPGEYELSPQEVKDFLEGLKN